MFPYDAHYALQGVGELAANARETHRPRWENMHTTLRPNNQPRLELDAHLYLPIEITTRREEAGYNQPCSLFAPRIRIRNNHWLVVSMLTVDSKPWEASGHTFRPRPGLAPCGLEAGGPDSLSGVRYSPLFTLVCFFQSDTPTYISDEFSPELRHYFYLLVIFQATFWIKHLARNTFSDFTPHFGLNI